MYLLLFVCLAHVANSEISNQTEPTTNQTKLDSTTSKQIHPNLDKAELSVKNQNEIQISFSANTTELINELKQSIEKLVAYLATSKTFKVEHAKTARRNNVFDIFPKFLRNKRSPENITDVNINNGTLYILNDTDNVTEVNISLTKSKNVTEAIPEVTNKPQETEYDDGPEWLEDSNSTSQERNLTEVDGRRSFNSDMEIANVIRSRLLSYVHEHINDTMVKIGSLKQIKNSFGADNAFNIGYIMANVDLIDVNLKKLSASIDKSHTDWAEAHILDVFDKVKFTNQVVTSLMSALKTIFNTVPRQRANEIIY